MLVVSGQSINELYASGLGVIAAHGLLEKTRNGPAYVAPTPVVTKWYDPTKRVLVDIRRRCNHAFHLNEAIWMLRGESYAIPLDTFVHDFSSRFAEPNGHIHGAYGDRWRKAFGIDQIKLVITILRTEPTSRQAVIQMWSADLDLGAKVKDKPCNTQLYFRLHDNSLDMTICNRSNDIIWGLYGANSVHFSILHEYIASQIDARVGTMYTFSNNFHAYKDVFDKLYDGKGGGQWYQHGEGIPLVNESPALFFTDVQNWDYGITTTGFKTRWFNEVAIPVTKTYLYRQWKNYPEMDSWLGRIADQNWYAGMRQWCRRGDEDGRQTEI